MWGSKRDWGMTRNYDLDYLLFQRTKFINNPVEYTKFNAERFWVMGFAIPVFQRGPEFDPERPIIEPLEDNAIGGDPRKVIQPVWSEQQMIRFLEAAVEGRGLGTWTYHRSEDKEAKRPDGSAYFPRDMWLIDGQQRFWSLHCFFNDKFPVYGKFWSEVETVDRRRFLSTAFTAYEMRDQSELALREAYDKLNFGGTPHREDQRALPGFKGR